MKFLIILVFFSLPLLSSCQDSISDISNDEMFIVVQKNDYGELDPRAFGKIEIKDGDPNVWQKGQLVLFRCDADYHGFAGKERFAYRITADSKLTKLGTFDINKSNIELQNDLENHKMKLNENNIPVKK